MDKHGLLEELQVLESIYVHELQVHKNEGGEATSITLQLHPSTGEDMEKRFVCMTLILDIPSEYPDSPPEIIIKSSRGIAEEEILSLREDMHLLCTECAGEPVLFELIEMAKDSLTAGNVPHCPCMICLEHFSESEKFTKTDCYHYFHEDCLARYVQHIQTDESNVLPHSTKPDQKKILCPICRKKISFKINDYCTIQEDEHFVYVPTPEMLLMQAKMSALFQKQKEQDGIIDIEAERNKYLVKGDDFIQLPMPKEPALSSPKTEKKTSKSGTGQQKKSQGRPSNGQHQYDSHSVRQERTNKNYDSRNIHKAQDCTHGTSYQRREDKKISVAERVNKNSFKDNKQIVESFDTGELNGISNKNMVEKETNELVAHLIDIENCGNQEKTNKDIVENIAKSTSTSSEQERYEEMMKLDPCEIKGFGQLRTSKELHHQDSRDKNESRHYKDSVMPEDKYEVKQYNVGRNRQNAAKKSQNKYESKYNTKTRYDQKMHGNVNLKNPVSLIEPNSEKTNEQELRSENYEIQHEKELLANDETSNKICPVLVINKHFEHENNDASNPDVSSKDGNVSPVQKYKHYPKEGFNSKDGSCKSRSYEKSTIFENTGYKHKNLSSRENKLESDMKKKDKNEMHSSITERNEVENKKGFDKYEHFKHRNYRYCKKPQEKMSYVNGVSSQKNRRDFCSSTHFEYGNNDKHSDLAGAHEEENKNVTQLRNEEMYESESLSHESEKGSLESGKYKYPGNSKHGVHVPSDLFVEKDVLNCKDGAERKLVEVGNHSVEEARNFDNFRNDDYNECCVENKVIVRKSNNAYEIVAKDSSSNGIRDSSKKGKKHQHYGSKRYERQFGEGYQNERSIHQQGAERKSYNGQKSSDADDEDGNMSNNDSKRYQEIFVTRVEHRPMSVQESLIVENVSNDDQLDKSEKNKNVKENDGNSVSGSNIYNKKYNSCGDVSDQDGQNSYRDDSDRDRQSSYRDRSGQDRKTSYRDGSGQDRKSFYRDSGRDKQRFYRNGNDHCRNNVYRGGNQDRNKIYRDGSGRDRHSLYGSGQDRNKHHSDTYIEKFSREKSQSDDHCSVGNITENEEVK